MRLFLRLMLKLGKLISALVRFFFLYLVRESAFEFPMKKILLLFSIFLSTTIFGQQRSLDFFMKEALQNSPYAIENKNQQLATKFDSLQIRAGLKPQVNFDNNNIYAPLINGIGYDKIITNGGSVSAVVGTNILISGKQNLNNQFENIQLRKGTLEIAGKLSEKELRKNITHLYILAYTEQEIINNSKDVFGVLKKENDLLKKLTEDGNYRQTDYLTFFINYKQQQLTIDQLELQLKNDYAILNYSCGIIDTTLLLLVNPELSRADFVSAENSIAGKQFFNDSLIFKNQYEQVKFNYRPHFNLFGDAGYVSTLSYQAEKNFGVSAGFHIAVPIYDGKLKDLKFGRLKLTENTRMNYVALYRKQYTQSVLRIIQQLNAIDDLIVENKNQYLLSESLVNANKKLLITGDVRMSEYILALTNYLYARSNAIQLLGSKMELVNEFNYLNY